MSTAVSTSNQWIPVLGVLLGASIGFLASFLSATYTKKKDAELACDERNRNRIERIFQLLIILRSQNMELLGSAISYIKHSQDFTTQKIEKFPPIFELEMLIDLYLPSLNTFKNDYVEQLRAFNAKCFELKRMSSTNENNTRELILLNQKTEILFREFKNQLTKLAKA